MKQYRFTADTDSIKDFPVEKLYRDVKLMTIGEGTSEVQKMVIARNILNMF